MGDDIRLRRLEQNYELLRSEMLQVKAQAKQYMQETALIEAQAASALAEARNEIEELRIENARLRTIVEERNGKA